MFDASVNIWKNLSFAFAGLRYAFISQRSLRIEAACAGLFVVSGFVLGLSKLEWVLVAVLISLVVGLELVNTAVESVVDLVSPNFHPLAKVAKDTAAAAVLVVSFVSVIAGLILLLS